MTYGSQTAMPVRPRDFEQRYGRRLAARAVLEDAGYSLDRPPDHSEIEPLAFELCFAGTEDRLSQHWQLFGAAEPERQRYTIDDPELEAKRCVVVTPVPHPLLAASMIAIGWWQQGPRTFAGPKVSGQDERANRHLLGRALDLIPRQVLYGPASFAAGQRLRGRAGEVDKLLRERLGAERTLVLQEQPEEGPLARCAVLLSATKDNRPRLTLCTRPGGFLVEGGPLDRFGLKGVGKPALLYPDEAVELCVAARDDGYRILDPDAILEPLERRVRSGAVVRPVAGLPSRAYLVIGQAQGPPARRLETSARHAVAEAERRGEHGSRVLVAPEVRDVAEMAEAGAVTHPVPIGPQAEAVGRYLATDYGVLIASGTGTGKCISGATLVELNGRLVSAEEAWERYAGQRRSDGEGEWAIPAEPLRVSSIAADGRIVAGAVTHLYRQRVREVARRVVLDDGAEVTITHRHRLHGPDGWVREIRVGNRVCVPAASGHDGRPVDRDLAVLAAWEIAEGDESGEGKPPLLRITQRDRERLEALRAIAERVGRRYHLRLNSMPIKVRGARSPVLHINSADYRDFWRSIGGTWGAKSAAKRIPDLIMEGDRECARVFLRHFFEAEGSVASSGYRRVEITSASRELMSQLAALLRRFGVWLRVQAKRKSASNGSGVVRSYWTGYIGGSSLRAFAAEIGFDSYRKSSRLADAVRAPVNDNVDTVPIADVLNRFESRGVPRRWMMEPGVRLRHGTVNRANAPSLLAAFDEVATLADGGNVSDFRGRHTTAALQATRGIGGAGFRLAARQLQARAERQVFYAKVVAVEDVPLDGYVYDFTVAEHHNYVAGGMLCHNTAILSVALDMKAERLEGLRALVVVKRALRGQFSDELRRFFPKAQLLETEMAGIARAIRQADHQAGPQPLVVLATYDQVRERAKQFTAIDWDDLAVDEDGHLMAPASQTAKALWLLRPKAQTASVLSATPLRRRLRDLECILAWVREDREMLERHSFSRQFPSQSTASMERLQEALGPVVVRFTRDDPVMRSLMPRLAAAEVVRIDPRAEEQRVIDAFNKGVVELYNELVARLDQVAGMRKGDPQIARAKEEAQELRRHITGRIVAGRGLFCDLETSRHTDNRLVPLLNRNGLIDRALKAIPSKRQIVAQAVADAASDELPVLVFADQAQWALHHLAEELQERHGVESGLLTGHTPDSERELLKRRFMAGELEALLLNERYSHGQNLQRAKVVCHLNLPWVYVDFEQRNGRASRLGAKRPGEEVQVWVPTLRGSLEEKVAQHLLPRAVLAHSVLDQGRVELRDSEVGRQVGALIEEFGRDEEASLAMRVAHAIWEAGRRWRGSG